MNFWPLICDFCGKGNHKLRMNKNRRIMCHFCFCKLEDEYELKEVESEIYGNDEQDPGTEREDVDTGGQVQGNDESPGEEESEGTDQGSEETDRCE